MKSIRIFSAMVLTCGLSACGGGGGGGSGVPANAPATAIHGIAHDGPIMDGVVTVYSFATGAKGGFIAQGLTDAQGNYSLSIDAPTQPILIEITGGSYVEEGSGLSVSLAVTQSLRAVSLYTLGSAVNAHVTYYTHIAAGLAEYYAHHGHSVETAVINANSEINSLTGLSILSTPPLVVTDRANASAALTPALQYGFFTGGISQWTLDASTINGSAAHSVHNSISFAQHALDDIVADGRLDGIGTAGPLSMGTIPLSADIYRHGLARAMLALVASPKNQTALNTAALLPAVKAYNDSAGAIFGAHPVIPIDQEGAVFSAVLPTAGAAIRSSVAVTGLVSDILGVTGVALKIDGVAQGNATNLAAPNFALNTLTLTDGTHALTLEATDLLGKVTSYSETVTVDNTLPVIAVTSISGMVDGLSGGTCSVSGTVADATTLIQSFTINGAAVSFAGGRWSYAMYVPPPPGSLTGPYYFSTTAIDAAGNIAQRNVHVFGSNPAPASALASVDWTRIWAGLPILPSLVSSAHAATVVLVLPCVL